MGGSAANKIRVEFFGKDRTLGKSFSQQWKKADTFDKKMQLVGHRLGQTLKRGAMIGAAALAGLAVAGVAALAALTVKSVRLAVDFEESMKKIQGLVGATKGQMTLYEDSILDMGVAYGVSAKAAADAMYFITGVGFKGKAAVDVLNATVKASATGLGEANDIAKALTRVLSVYGKENITAAHAADTLTAAVNFGNMEAEELAENVGKVIPMAKQLGVTWDDVAGLMAASSLVLDVDEAAVALNAFWTSLIKPKAEGVKALKEVGLSYAELRKTVEDQGTVEAMRQLEEAFDGDIEAMVKVVGETRAVKGMLVLLGMDAKQVDKILGDVKNSSGALDKAWNKVSKGTGVKFRQVTEGLNSVLTKLGAAILPAVRLILEKITTKWLPKFSDWVSNHKKEITDTFMQMADGVVAFGDYLIKNWPAIRDSLVHIASAAKKVADAIGAAASALGSFSRDAEGYDTKTGKPTMTSKILNWWPSWWPDSWKAEGGIVNRPVIAGEDGPEAIIPLTKPRRAAQVMAQAGLLGGSGGDIVFQNCNFSAHTPREIAYQVRDVLVGDMRVAARTAGAFA
jgi:TP901 family phage tail tape measure protein